MLKKTRKNKNIFRIFVNKKQKLINQMQEEMLKIETWRDIEGYEGLYEVSNLGNVRSLNYLRTGKTKILKVRKYKNGYLYVDLCKNGKPKNFMIHRLVANAFISNPQNLPQVNHKDENKENNHVSNLEWCTCAYNLNYGTHNQRIAEKNSKPVISTDKNGNEEYFPSIMEAERRYGFKNQHICDCLKGRQKTHKGRTWQYVSK